MNDLTSGGFCEALLVSSAYQDQSSDIWQSTPFVVLKTW
jgi:hypothetical protein